MWDVLYAIDASSSMGESHSSRRGRFVKIDSVKRSIGDLLKAGDFPYGSRLGVLTFQAPTRAGGIFLAGGQEMVKVVLPLTRTDALTREDIEAKLSKIQVSGATPTGIAIEEGLRQLYGSDEGQMKRIKKLIMITDERSNVGPKPEKVVSDEVAVRAIIDVIAIGGKVNRETLEKVTKKTGGKFTVVEGADELYAAMKPSIEIRGLGVDEGLLAEAADASKELEARKAGGAASMEYRQALEKARQVRARVNKRLAEVLMLKSASDSEVELLASQLEKGLPMKEYAAKVWPRASELEQVEKIEKELRKAMDRLAA
ncbi:MAG: VWA domain-containing protein [Thaumarchaeota archaeon]|nr:VWA domain-containing protein [Nitrososphaerota archaeon]